MRYKLGNHRPIKYILDFNGCHICTSHSIGKNGYPKIKINKKTMTMHRYIYEKCFGNIPDRLVVRHICDNKLCINPEHLLLGSIQDNVKDMVSRNRQAKGINNGTAKLTEKIVEEILLNTTDNQVYLADKYGVDQAVISSIQLGKIWKHIRPDLSREGRGRPFGEKSGRAKLSEVEAIAIFNNTEDTRSDLAAKYGVSVQTIWDIKRKRSWKFLHKQLI